MPVQLRDIPGFTNYAVTRDGRVWSKRFGGRWLSSIKHKNDYLFVHIGKLRSIQRIVLESWVGPCPEGMEACHNNGVRTDNRLENLRWDTQSENHKDAVRHGTHTGLFPGKRNICKLTKDQAQCILNLARLRREPHHLIALRFGISTGTVSDIFRGRSWKCLCP